MMRMGHQPKHSPLRMHTRGHRQAIKIAAAALCLALALLIISKSMLVSLSSANPELAAAFLKSSPAVRFALANQTIAKARQKNLDQLLKQQATDWTSSALRDEPFNAQGLEMMGLLAASDADFTTTERFMSAASRQSLRLQSAAYWNLKSRLAAQDYTAAAGYADALLRAKPQSIFRVAWPAVAGKTRMRSNSRPRRMKRVMHVIAGLGTGGTEVMCLRLARHWQGRFDQHILAWETSSRSLERDFQQLSQTSVSVIPPDKQTHLQRWRWVRAKVAQVKPDAVLIHCFGIPHIISAVAARSVGVSSIGAWAGNPPSRTLMSRLRFTVVLLASRIVQCPVVSCSSAVAQEFGKLSIGMPARSAIVPNAIDVADILSTARKSRDSRCDLTPTIAMVSRLDIIKDHATLLDAFAKIHRDIPNARLWIIGDGSLRTSLEEHARNLGISKSTTFFGNRTDVASLLGQADVFAFSTTRDEGFGIVLIEAMAAGIPIVATDVAACREVLANGEAGLLVAPSDADALAMAICNMLNTPELRAHMSSNSLRRVRAEYSIERCAQRWETQLFGTQQPIDRLVECES